MRLPNIQAPVLTPTQPGSDLLPMVVENVCLAFHGRTVFAGLSLNLPSRGITAVMGPNGAGKSLLLRVMAGLVEPDAGRVRFGGHSRLPKNALGFVFQRPVLLRRSVHANLMHALRLAGLRGDECSQRARALLTQGELLHLEHSPARKLSGGEQQRLTLLRALACKPGVLLLDEPSASLDPQATVLIENLIRHVSQSGVKVVIVTHDAGQTARLADEVVFIHRGQVLEITPTPEFLKRANSPEARAYLAGELLTT
ncbi:MAG TPA: ATP-binding cassette domain-containing protein [Limnobacter sp.]|nr:ATP-binding cassette domain-containing protein [Limnobacter sp.]